MLLRRTTPYLLFTVLSMLSVYCRGDAIPTPLSGLFAHDSKDVVIELVQRDGLTRGLIRRQDDIPEQEGKVLLRDLKYDGKQQMWSGRLCLLRKGEERDIWLQMPDADHLRITVQDDLLQRRVFWHRVYSVRH